MPGSDYDCVEIGHHTAQKFWQTQVGSVDAAHDKRNRSCHGLETGDSLPDLMLRGPVALRCHIGTERRPHGKLSNGTVGVE